MKVQVLLGLSFLFIFFLSGTFSVFAQQQNFENEEHIKSFNVELTVNPDSSVLVHENILYYFESPKHGIFREIPIQYSDQYGVEKNLRVDEISVTDEKGKAYPFDLSEGKNLTLKIGDPNRQITGDHIYNISYRVRNALGYFSDFDEIYWNAIGNGWLIPILSHSVTLTLPTALPWLDWRLSCYIGQTGSKDSCGEKTDFPYTENQNIQKIVLSGQEILFPGDGVTIALGFPKGMAHQPNFFEKTISFLQDNPIVWLPFLVFGVFFTLWYRRGRDPRGRGVIIPEYDVPNGFSALDIAAMMHGGVSAAEISAAIIELAVHGFIKIEKKIEKKFFINTEQYTLYRLDKESKTKNERMLLDALFSDSKSVELSDLKNKFYTNIKTIESSVLDSLVSQKYFVQNPKKQMVKYFALGAVVIVPLFFFGFIHTLIGFISVTLASIIYLIFAYLMPKVTYEGALVKEKILGLKEYLQIAEKNRLEFHNAPEKNPDLFEKLLPAAMILGVTALWAKEFADIYTQPPQWYSGPIGSNFSALSLGSDLNSFSSAAASTLASTPGGSSGGGGFSGGGSGGGGGGSW